ncbi:carboxymuconolactone decarboxylase family protein [Bacillus spizizenii]|uniref:carboxymuconolactone decarboxylase family protein n=1 Tax=Bacillus TaxID=1386 RepID=UPI00227DEBCE|nr:carboxymuconolactone decarboxylase family protein [Bacillus inaquosorum]MCY8685580.1 carboxymuconolactone decarboxylase family protein [Bacillus spizizenii]MCY8170929.1 carboxymuconolactone decarboxylase family protein [Bacillus inaquosorum]MCY8357131.1 carboxymuconolactone decarboxylase family protein [Bacillus inaquosorum]MCY9328284.1 carboxymuconolactone decarboxylase family protein [Bacillus spizizenii]MEC0520975.1 carboxymuconolactone decarboxylase family protein [Bacillus inaquosorum]
MDRVEKSKEKYKKLFGNGVPAVYATDPDFQDILSCFIFGEISHHGNLDDRQRELITLVVLTANQTLPQLKAHVAAALNVGLTPVEIKEAVYQCAPYIGFPKTLNAINEVNEVFKAKNVTLPIESQKTVDEENRFDKGLSVQVEIFGDVITKMRESTPKNQKHMQDYLSSFCFGDFYTRGGLDLKTRELLTLCIISTLGGCESQVKSHVLGNKNVGNGKETLVTAITHCLPYIGFPRTLNALACINEIIPEN